MNPTLLAVVADALDFPTELDNTFSDADAVARQEIVDEMNEAAEIATVEANLAELVAAAQDYVDLVNRAMSAYELAELERDHETAILERDGL
jgi:hypothetical protein